MIVNIERTVVNMKAVDHLLGESPAIADRLCAAKLVEVAKVSVHEVDDKQSALKALPFLEVERNFC